MPNNKNQHYVPRCVLKPFSLKGEGHAINLYAIKKEKLIQNAPLKNQSARDYLYGSDGAVESTLSIIEGQYASVLRRVMSKSETREDLELLRFFGYLQLRRTEMAIKRLQKSYELMDEHIFEQAASLPPPGYFMHQSLKLCLETRQAIEDLKVRIVENRTHANFITSDDPAVLSNKHHNQKLNTTDFGITSSGLILTMPLAPKVALLCYDSKVYTVPALEGSRVIFTKPNDVHALNELQLLKAGSSIYFGPWSDGGEVQAQFESARHRRPEQWASYKYLVFVSAGEQGEIYREGTREEAKAAKKSIVNLSFNYPAPAQWPSALKFRQPIKTFSNGSMVGHVRQEEWLSSSPDFDSHAVS